MTKEAKSEKVKVIVIRPILLKGKEIKVHSLLKFDPSDEKQKPILESLLARKLVILEADFAKFLKEAELAITKEDIAEKAIALITAPKMGLPKEA